uniref:CCT-beta n=2 Tax=Cyprinus carpio TaxID=7962 RepID=A0A8C1YDQ1_CYPCA
MSVCVCVCPQASLSMTPMNIFRHGADEEKAETARLSSFIGAIAIGDLVKSTLGPKGMRIENANILIANTGMDTDKIKIFGSRVRVDSTAKVAEIETAEKEKMKEKVERILKHGINCFINRQLIYNYPEQLFASAGVMAIEHADFMGVERLALVTGGEITSTFDHPELVKLGHCKLIEEVMIGEDMLIHFSGVDMGEACTIVLRGATQQILDEAERSLHDALCVLAQTIKETRTVFGGGCSEMLMAKAVSDLANRTPGKEAVAMESFAKALMMLPTIIADNAGYDSAELVSQLRAAHQDKKSTFGLDMTQGTVGDMAALGITESFQVKRQVLLSAAEAAEMILRVDNIIKAKHQCRVLTSLCVCVCVSGSVCRIITPAEHS